MNETLLLVLSWLPIVAESGLFVVIAKFVAKKMKDHFSMPEKLTKEIKDLRSDLGRLNKAHYDLLELNKKLSEDNEALKMELRGIRSYGKENIKKN